MQIVVPNSPNSLASTAREKVSISFSASATKSGLAVKNAVYMSIVLQLLLHLK